MRIRKRLLQLQNKPINQNITIRNKNIITYGIL
jgi:hypothetical protein